MGSRIMAVRFKFRSQAPQRRKSSTDAMVSKICLNISSGVELAVTDMPKVVR